MGLIAFFRNNWVLVLLLALPACGSQLSLENYSKLKVGQSFDEVKKTIGDPARCDELLGIRTCVWGDEKRGASIGFVADKVMLLSATNLR